MSHVIEPSLNIKGQPIVNTQTDAARFEKYYGVNVCYPSKYLGGVTPIVHSFLWMFFTAGEELADVEYEPKIRECKDLSTTITYIETPKLKNNCFNNTCVRVWDNRNP